MFHHIKIKVALILSGMVAFKTIYKKKSHVFVSNDFVSIDAKASEIADYVGEIKQFVNVKTDHHQMENLSKEAKSLLNK
jgi:hypothetical protein